MVVQTHLKQNRKTFHSKYHQVAKQVELQYGLIHKNLTSRFHRERNEIVLVRVKLGNLVKKSLIPNEKNIAVESIYTNSIFTRLGLNESQHLYEDNLDWTRGRFSGQIVKIIISKGQIIEKIFITPQGNRISVKRVELGLLARLSLKQ
tara:strand:- start:3729 stop:4172 length:444 start_codon:yes stop_codon:yes gene_type:complete